MRTLSLVFASLCLIACGEEEHDALDEFNFPATLAELSPTHALRVQRLTDDRVKVELTYEGEDRREHCPVIDAIAIVNDVEHPLTFAGGAIASSPSGFACTGPSFSYRLPEGESATSELKIVIEDATHRIEASFADIWIEAALTIEGDITTFEEGQTGTLQIQPRSLQTELELPGVTVTYAKEFSYNCDMICRHARSVPLMTEAVVDNRIEFAVANDEAWDGLTVRSGPGILNVSGDLQVPVTHCTGVLSCSGLVPMPPGVPIEVIPTST